MATILTKQRYRGATDGSYAGDSALAEIFIREALGALLDCGFVVPALGETQVVAGNSAVWTSLVDSAHGLLGPEERARAARFRFERDFNTYVLSHALWRVALARSLDTDACKVRLTRTAAGQPRLAGDAFSTSLSHSGSWMAIAICSGTTVGVDIECSMSRGALTELMPSICSPAEITHVMQLPDTERETFLLALWTRKEAVLKALGVGLNSDPSLFSAMTPGTMLPPPEVSDRTPCRISDLVLPAGLIGAIAVPEEVTTIRLGVMQSLSDGHRAELKGD